MLDGRIPSGNTLSQNHTLKVFTYKGFQRVILPKHIKGVLKMSKFEIVSHGHKHAFDTAKWDDEVLLAHAKQGIKIRLDRSSASLTKKDGSTDKDRLDACKKVAETIQSGEMPKSGGGGSRLSIDDRGLKTVLKTLMTFNKGESIPDAITRYTKALAVKQGQEYTEDMDEKVIDFLRKTPVYTSFVELEQARSNKTNDIDGLSL